MPGPSEASVDVAIVGGGITGSAAFQYLTAAGVDTLLIESGELNTEASGSNSGSLHGQIPQDTFLDLGERWAQTFLPSLRLLHASIALWEEADEAEGGALEVRLGGGLMLARTENELRAIERKAAFDRAAGGSYEILDRTDLRRRAPYLSPELCGAGFCPREGKASPLVAAPVLARRGLAAGGRILRRQRVQSITADASAYHLQLTRGRVRAGRIILAAGAGCASIDGIPALGRLPIQSVPIQVAVTEPLEPLTSSLLYYARAPLTMKQTAAGTMVIGGGWPAQYDRQHRPVPDAHSLAQNLGLALEVMPRLADVAIVRSWAATVNGTPDWKPIIGEVPGSPGIYLGYVPWMGFTGGLAAARMVANLASGQALANGLAMETDDLKSFALS